MDFVVHVPNTNMCLCITVVELKKIGQRNINVGTTLPLKTNCDIIKVYVTFASHFYEKDITTKFLTRMYNCYEGALYLCQL